ncbi:MAG: chloramphenicol acetyltransferase [Firmicutes bacterium]|nr:chloramphenicol acetyltransferase [Bacillota bacterium]
MKYIDMENWGRKKHFKHFNNLDYPHINICANVDITSFYSYIKINDLNFFKSLLYLVTTTINEIKEFRYRIRDGLVVEHEIVHPSFTKMNEGDIFSFCKATYNRDFKTFLEDVNRMMERKELDLEDEVKDDRIYITSMPWVAFTSVTHPIHMNPVDSIPRIAFGKYFSENDKILMPLSVQAHHALVDGIHVGKFYKRVQYFLDNPNKLLT